MGGVSTFAFELSKALSELTAGCVYLGPRSARFSVSSQRFWLYNDWESDPTLRAGRGSKLEDERLCELISRVVEAFELTHLIAYHAYYYAPAMISVGRALGLPTAVVVHGTELTSQYPEIADGRRIPYDRHFRGTDLKDRLGQVVTEADFVLANSSYTASIVERIAPGISARAIGCGISRAVFDREIAETPFYDPTQKRARRAALGLDANFLMIYVGRLVRHKNLELFIELCTLTGFKGIIAGSGPMRASLEARAKKSGANVAFTGQVDDATKWQLLRAADFGYLMSTYDERTGAYEGFGISMLEYCVAGAICVSNGHHGTSDFATETMTSIGGVGSAQEISQKLLSAANDPQMMGMLVAKARSIVSHQFTWDLVARKALEIIDED